MEREGGVAAPSGSLLLFPGALGDAVCVEPAVAWLATRGPVTFLARGAAAEVAALFPARPTIGSIDDVRVARLFAPKAAGDDAPAWLAAFERVVSFTGAASEDFRARLARVPGARVVPFPARTGTIHAVDEMLAAASAGAAPAGAAPVLHLPEPAERGSEGRRLALHPGSGGRGKRAPRVLFLEVARRWREEIGGDVSVLLGPAEEGEEAWWRDRAGSVERPPTVAALARRLREATVHLGNDAGPSHVAAALGTPVVVAFTSTAPGRFGPRGPRVRHVAVEPRGSDAEPVWRAVRAALP